MGALPLGALPESPGATEAASAPCSVGRRSAEAGQPSGGLQEASCPRACGCCCRHFSPALVQLTAPLGQRGRERQEGEGPPLSPSALRQGLKMTPWQPTCASPTSPPPRSWPLWGHLSLPGCQTHHQPSSRPSGIQQVSGGEGAPEDLLMGGQTALTINRPWVMFILSQGEARGWPSTAGWGAGWNLFWQPTAAMGGGRTLLSQAHPQSPGRRSREDVAAAGGAGGSGQGGS